MAAGVLAGTLALASVGVGQPTNGNLPSSTVASDRMSRLPITMDGLIVSGLVSDPNGAVVPGAQVTLRNVKTDVTRSKVADGNGKFEFTDVEPGDYEASVTATGFRRLLIQNIRASEDVTLDAKLDAGEESIEVGIVALLPEPIREPLDLKTLDVELQSRPIQPLTGKKKKTKKNLPK
jgi:hypothetical protein